MVRKRGWIPRLARAATGALASSCASGATASAVPVAILTAPASLAPETSIAICLAGCATGWRREAAGAAPDVDRPRGVRGHGLRRGGDRAVAALGPQASARIRAGRLGPISDKPWTSDPRRKGGYRVRGLPRLRARWVQESRNRRVRQLPRQGGRGRAPRRPRGGGDHLSIVPRLRAGYSKTDVHWLPRQAPRREPCRGPTRDARVRPVPQDP